MFVAFPFASIAFSHVISSEKRQIDTGSKSFYHPPRFMIVQSPIGVKATFKLDTFTGNVYQLQVDTAGKDLWFPLIRLPATTTADITYPNSNNYTLSVSTLAIRYTFILNVNTGATWEWVVNPKTKETFFAPMSDSF